MLERTHLTVIREVTRLGTLTAAAAALHVTQSALSHATRKLEREFGAAIWVREGRSLRLTQAGRHLLAVAQRVLPQFERAEERLAQYGRGQRGALRIGMECHPCYQWLLKVVAPYLAAWPDVDVDVKQEFQFSGIEALADHEIDLLVTPDPVYRSGLHFEPVFDYEQVLVVGAAHPLAGARYVTPAQLADQVLITYPVALERLDIYTQFLGPAGIMPLRRKTIETTDIMLQMVATGRGVTALPRWLVEEYRGRPALVVLRLGEGGIPKQIHLGSRAGELDTDYLRGFIDLAQATRRAGTPPA